MKTTKLPIVDAAAGATLLSTGLVIINENCEFFQKALNNEITDFERAYRLFLTISHENIHFVQTYTTAFTYSYSLNLLDLCAQFMEESRRGNLNKEIFQKYLVSYHSIISVFLQKNNGISTVDLLEAVAVTESFVITFKVSSNISFERYLNDYYPDSSSVYRTVPDLFIREFGEEVTIHLLPIVCFLSLNGDRPSVNFWIFFKELEKLSKTQLLQFNAWTLTKYFRMDPYRSLINIYMNLKNYNGEHKIFVPQLQVLSRLGRFEEIYEFCAKPSIWFRNKEKVSNLLPPFTLFSGGYVLKNGLALKWNEQESFSFLDTASLFGTFQALMSKDIPYTSCLHTICPFHSNSLCHSWYSVPTNIKWDQCAYPKRFEIQFKMDENKLINLRNNAFNDFDSSSIKKPEDIELQPTLGKTKDEYERVLNNAARLTDPLEWDKIVIDLLKEAQINDLNNELFDNTSYLVMSVAGYLLDMTDIKLNCFNKWMLKEPFRISNEYVLIVLNFASQIQRQISPWFGIVLLRALKMIYRSPGSIIFDVYAEPKRIQNEIENYSIMI